MKSKTAQRVDAAIERNQSAAPTTELVSRSARLTYCINKASREAVEAKIRYIRSCRDMARNLTEAAQKAEDGLYVSETVMSSSLVQDIPKLAVQYKAAAENLTMLRQIEEDV
jgi:hypothetical protein